MGVPRVVWLGNGTPLLRRGCCFWRGYDARRKLELLDCVPEIGHPLLLGAVLLIPPTTFSSSSSSSSPRRACCSIMPISNPFVSPSQ
jgi:hypothetical protein